MIFKRASIFELSEFLKRTWQLRIWRSGGATLSRWMMLLEARVMAVVQVRMLHPLAPFNTPMLRRARSGPLVVLGGFEGQLPSQKKRSQTFAQELKQLSSFSIGLASRARTCQIKTVVKLENHFNAGIRWGEATLAPAFLHGFLTGSTRWVCRVTAKLRGGCLVFLMVRRWTDRRFEWKWGVFCSQVSLRRWAMQAPRSIYRMRTPASTSWCYTGARINQDVCWNVIGTLGSWFTCGSLVGSVWTSGPGTLQKGNCVKSCCMRCPQKAFNLLRHRCQQCVKRSEIDEQAEPCEILVKRTEISEHCCARYRNTLLPSRKGRSFGPSEAALPRVKTVPSLRRTVTWSSDLSNKLHDFMTWYGLCRFETWKVFQRRWSLKMPWNVGSLSPYKDMFLLVHRSMYVIHGNLQYLIWMLLKFGKWMFICLSRSSKPARFARPPRSCRESQRPCSAHFEGAVHGRGRSKKVPKDVTQRIWEHEEVGMWEVCLLLWDMCSEDFVRALHKIPKKMHETWENAVEPRGSHRDAACKLRWPRMDGTFFVMWSSEWLGIWSFQSWSFCHGPRIFSSDTSWVDAKFLEWDEIVCSLRHDSSNGLCTCIYCI